MAGDDRKDQLVVRAQVPSDAVTVERAEDAGTPAPGQDIRYLTEQEEARERLRASVDRLTRQASLQVQLQKEPLKMIGGASAVGAVVGLVVGRQFRRSKKVYVDAHSPVKHQKAFIKAQKKQAKGKNDVGGALVATLGTLAVRMLTDKVLAPKLEQVASGLLAKAGQEGGGRSTTASARARAEKPDLAARPVTVPATAAPAVAVPVAAPTPAQDDALTVAPVHPGVVPLPESQVEAKVQGTPIPEGEKRNPNAH